jgi:O-antigen ligase
MQVQSWTKAWYLFAGPVISLGFLPGLTLEPFATTKLFLLSIFSGLGAAEVVLALSTRNLKFKDFRIICYFSFILILLIPLLFAEAPFQQQLYGTSGRLTGFLHYFFLANIFLGLCINVNASKVESILSSLVLTGSIEAIYGIIQYLGLDWVKWNNPQSYIFGTLGNPNFLSSLLGLSGIVTLFRLVDKKEIKIRFLYFLHLILFIIVIILSKSVQGLFLFTIGVFALIAVITSKKSFGLLFTWLAVSAIAFSVAILGILRIGPLSKFLYQDSVTFRGDYWRAGISMFKNNLFFGVGLDSYGDNYRAYRDTLATSRRGLDSISNSAHNLLIDLASTGGLALFIYCVSLNVFTAFIVFKEINSSRKLEFLDACLITLWVCYSAQALISINVASIAIWGTLFNALVIGYFLNIPKTQVVVSRSKGKSQPKFGTYKFQIIFILLFSILVLPLFASDIEIANSLKKNDLGKVVSTATSWPERCDLMSGAQNLALSQKNYQLALEVAKKAVDSNSKCYTALLAITQNPKSTFEDLSNAKKLLKLVEPNSPN